jgi:tRNA threonylcarbamoyl adenosine modification protein YeaZ
MSLPCLELSIDTSGNTLVLDLWKVNKSAPLFRYETSIQQQRTHSALLVPLLKEALEANDFTPAHLAKLYYCQGPGSFTGLRASLSVVRTLGQFLPQLQLYAIDGLTRRFFQALPELPPHETQVTVALDARRKRLYAATFRLHQGEWHVHHSPALLTDDALSLQLEIAEGHSWIAEASLYERLALPQNIRLIEEATLTVSAGEALRRATQQMAISPQAWHTLDALYLQAPNVSIPTHLNLPTFEEMERMTHDL